MDAVINVVLWVVFWAGVAVVTGECLLWIIRWLTDHDNDPPYGGGFGGSY